MKKPEYKLPKTILLSLIMILLPPCFVNAKSPPDMHPGHMVTIRPQEYNGPVRNPFKGIESRLKLPLTEKSNTKEWYKLGSVINLRGYFHWHTIESHKNSGKEKITARVNYLLDGFENYNCHGRYRSSPGVGTGYVETFLPNDLPETDYLNQTAYFHRRVAKTIQNLGETLDGDPRIALVEIGFIGKWGEQHNPTPTPETQEIMGQAYTDYFKKTLIYNRNVNQFKDFKFGYFNDAAMEIGGCGGSMEKFVAGRHPDLWKTYPMEGEVRSWSGAIMGTDHNPMVVLQDNNKTRWAINNIRWSHYSHCCLLGQVWWYGSAPRGFPGWDKLTRHEKENLFDIHKAFGYRFIITEFKYESSMSPGDVFDVSFKVVNEGAAPMYYKWPVEISLLDPVSRAPVWKETFTGVDIRAWIGGEGFPVGPGEGHKNFQSALYEYTTPAPAYNIKNTFRLPADIPNGTYIIALAVLSPKGTPALRFAVSNYFNGGRHPMGYVGVNLEPGQVEIDPADFDDIFNDPLCIPDNPETIKSRSNRSGLFSEN